MKLSKRTTTASLIVVLLACFFAIASSTAVQVRYHLWRLQATHDAIWSKPTDVLPNGLAGYGNGQLFDRFNYHRNRLTKLGYLFHKTYDFDQLQEIEGATTALFRRYITRSPHAGPLPWVEGSNSIEVWDRPDNEAKWDALHEQHNTPDFAAKHAGLIKQVLAERLSAPH